MQVGAELDRWARLERRVNDGNGTPEENELILTNLSHRAQLAHDRAWAQTAAANPTARHPPSGGRWKGLGPRRTLHAVVCGDAGTEVLAVA